MGSFSFEILQNVHSISYCSGSPFLEIIRYSWICMEAAFPRIKDTPDPDLPVWQQFLEFSLFSLSPSSKAALPTGLPHPSSPSDVTLMRGCSRAFASVTWPAHLWEFAKSTVSGPTPHPWNQRFWAGPSNQCCLNSFRR